jgi:hypothetical protein
MEYYLAFKKKEILTRARIWMNLEYIVVSEINQSQKDNNVWFLEYRICRIVKFIEPVSQVPVAHA